VLIQDEKPDDSVAFSEKAYNKAMEAYNKSAVLYASDNLKKADEAISEAEAAYAEKLSPDNYAKAKDQYASANEKFENKDYVASAALADEAYNSAVKAKEDSLDGKYQLKAKIDEVRSTLAKVKRYDYEPYARDKYNIADGKLKEAERSYNNGTLKDGFDAIGVAKTNADAAYAATMNGIAEKKLKDAEAAINQAKKSGINTDDLDAANEALARARSFKDRGNYEDSITYSDEAIRLANRAIEDAEKQPVVVAKGDDEPDYGDEGDDVESAETTKRKDVDEDENYYYYKVKTWSKHNESLSRIAKEFYKNPKAWKKIYNANKDKIKNPDLIKPDWILKIPKK
jgi:tetratricopeptide (TPR) repeat protein